MAKRACTCGECSECLEIMGREQAETRDRYERGLSDWGNY